MAKKRTRKKIKRKNKKVISPARGASAPEYFLFGLIMAGVILFSFLCIQGSKQVQTSFSMVDYSKEKIAFEKKIQKLVKGYPIQKMSPYISRKNKRVASFLVAIAKKESNWGRHAPKKEGKECFNYWGSLGIADPTASGSSCFVLPQHAVNVVGGRIAELVAEKIYTPKEMIVWKCGTASCVRRDRSAAKWIWDVGYYYKKIYPTVKSKNKTVAFKL